MERLREDSSDNALELDWASSPFGRGREPWFLKTVPVSVHYFGDEGEYEHRATALASTDNVLHETAMKATFVDLIHLVHRQR